MHETEKINWMLDQLQDKKAYLFDRDRFIPEKHLNLDFLKSNGVAGFFKYLDFALLFETFGLLMFSDTYMALLEDEAIRCTQAQDDRIAYWNARDQFEEQFLSEGT
ncbi:hypothetical protein [Paraburkholderia aromaticivorans]|uniref:hypothetical protein n=1 Tax=Paraburkholderia aromaticivorans TaxID=2026199 RepID=UPI0038B7FD71